MNSRPDPDQLLKQVQADEASSHRGRLKLFFGASPGVGKTYAMLEAARQRKKEGWDVVIGLVETHKRAETEALLEGLDVLPRKEISYKGVVLKEFDLDAALERRPRLLVVDELAHSNAEGLRHTKRWQDVEELLDAGIDVYTTLNVQHWESINDVVSQITGVVIRETVPDTFLERAHDLELVDLSPEDLLKRLKDGKVYKGEIAGRAADNFFKPGNLIALRELALRHTAERVDAQMQAFREKNAIRDVWTIGDKLLVGVSSSPLSARLIRATSRLATRLHAHWFAVYVETPNSIHRSEADRLRAIENLRLAEALGAETATLTGKDVTDEMLAFAKNHNVTRIVLGQPTRPRWKDWLTGSIVSEFARRCGNIDLHIISGTNEVEAARKPEQRTRRVGDWHRLGLSTLAVSVATLVCWPLSHSVDRANLVMVYLLAVMWTAYRSGRKVSAYAAVLSVLCFDFFFVPPYLTFAVSDTQYLLTFIIMLGVGLLISTLAGGMRYQTEAIRARAERMRSLYKLSRTLSETPDTRRMLGSAVTQLEEFYKLPVLILTGGPNGSLQTGAGNSEAFGLNENEFSVARWSFDRGQVAGAGSGTLSGARGLYVPLKGIRSTVGVLGLCAAEPARLLEPEALQLLESFASEIGGALESTRMTEQIGRAEAQIELQAINQPKADAGIRMSDVLNEKRILFLPDGLPSVDILRELLAVLSPPIVAKAFQAIQEREKAGPTVIGNAVAVPHALVSGVDKLQAAMAILPSGSVRIWLLFLSPADDPRLHLTFLAGVARFFRDPKQSEEMLHLLSAQDVLNFIRNRET